MKVTNANAIMADTRANSQLEISSVCINSQLDNFLQGTPYVTGTLQSHEALADERARPSCWNLTKQHPGSMLCLYKNQHCKRCTPSCSMLCVMRVATLSTRGPLYLKYS